MTKLPISGQVADLPMPPAALHQRPVQLLGRELGHIVVLVNDRDKDGHVREQAAAVLAPHGQLNLRPHLVVKALGHT